MTLQLKTLCFKSLQNPGRCFRLIRSVVLGATLIGLLLTTGCSEETPQDRLTAAREALRTGNTKLAEELARTIPDKDRGWNEAQMLLAKIAESRGDSAAVMDYIDAMKRDGSEISVKAAQQAADSQLKNCQLTKAAQNYEYLVGSRPNDITTRSTLASILTLSGQRSRAEVHLLHLLRSGSIELEDLVTLSQPERPPRPNTTSGAMRRRQERRSPCGIWPSTDRYGGSAIL